MYTFTIDSDKFSRVYVSFSGGKDSVGTFIKVRDRFPKEKICLIFTDTGHEMPETYDYLRYFHAEVFPVVRLCSHLVSISATGRRKLENLELSWDVDVNTFKERGIVTIFDEIMYRYNSNPASPVWPGSGIRYCTRTLKINPFFKYIRARVPKEKRSKILIAKGLRREESKKRSDTSECVLDAEGGDFYHVWHPVYDLTTEQIFDLHRQNGIQINKVYDIRDRSNCVGCPFASNQEIRNTVQVYPTILDRYVQIEDVTGYTWKPKTRLSDVIAGSTAEEVQEEEMSCASGYCDI